MNTNLGKRRMAGKLGTTSLAMGGREARKGRQRGARRRRGIDRGSGNEIGSVSDEARICGFHGLMGRLISIATRAA
jgi:hypothetical protein